MSPDDESGFFWGDFVKDFTNLTPYYPIFLYLLAVVGFVVSSLVLTHVVGPNRKTPVKMMPYESGMDPIGDARQRFDVKFYLIAILFLVFDVELPTAIRPCFPRKSAAWFSGKCWCFSLLW
jgi:hypothetical protein